MFGFKKKQERVQETCSECGKRVHVGQDLCMYDGKYRHAKCMPKPRPGVDSRVLADSCCLGRVPGTWQDVRAEQDVSDWR